MKISARYKAISVTVPAEMEKALAEVCRKEIRKKSEVVTEALRLYFRARGGKPQVWSFVMPAGEEERAPIDYGALPVSDLRGAGLPAPSVVRPATLNASGIVRRLGALPKADQVQVAAAVRVFLAQ